MKKTLSMLLVLSMLLGCSAAWADDTGIQIIGGSVLEPETVNLDDWKVGDTAIISGYGEITLVEAKVVNTIASITKNGNGSSFNSGDEAEYLQLTIDILNTQTKEFDFYKAINSGICNYDRGDVTYQFGVWSRQFNSFTSAKVRSDKDNSSTIAPMYRGKYIIVVTLPNDVINSNGPLSLTFKIGENEFTYHHRK